MTRALVRPRLPRRLARLLPGSGAHQVVIAAAAVVAVVGTLTVPPPATTTAAWTDSENVHGLVGTSAFACGTDSGYAASASSRFLGGSLAGTSLDPVAALRGADLSRTRDGVVTATPTTPAPTTDAGGATTFRDPLSASAASGLVGLDLTGLSAGLPAGSASALSQYTRVTPTGTATAAAGLVTDAGGLGVTPTTPSTALPGPARVGLGSVLPPTTALDRAALTVGAVSSTATLDGCRALESEIWGDGSVTGVVRDYGIAGLGLELHSPAVAGLSGQVSSTVARLNTEVTGLVGRDGTISNAVKNGVLKTVSDITSLLSLGSVSGEVTLKGLPFQTAVDPLLEGSLTSTDGTVTITPSTGIVNVDLVKLIGPTGGVNGLAPNTELVLSATAMASIATTVGTMLDGLTQRLTSTLDAVVSSMNLSVALVVGVNLGAVPVLNVGVNMSGSLGQLLGISPGGSATVTPGVPLVSNLNILLGGALSRVTSALSGSSAFLLSSVADVVSRDLVTPITTLGTTLSTTLAPVLTEVGTLTTRLPSVLSLRVNLRPDQAGYPGGVVDVPPADKWGTRSYQVGALRVGLLDGVRTVTSLDLATSRVGSVSTVPR